MEDLDTITRRRRGTAPRGTERMRLLCRRLDDPQQAFPSVHVVGTDGKSSVTRMVACLFEALGVATGETTSPHLERVTERIRVRGTPIDDTTLVAITQRIMGELDTVDREAGHPVTFFEIVTAAAFEAFRHARVDVAVVEAGIGGGGDATAVVDASVTALTPVGTDHPELGATLDAVAREKLACVAAGSVLVSGRQRPQVARVIAEVAEAQNLRLLRHGRDFGVTTRRSQGNGQHVGLRGLDGFAVRGWLPLHGAHQAANAAQALATVQAWLGCSDIDPDRVRAGLAAARIPGRIELVRRDGAPPVLLDGAHDDTAATALAGAVRELKGSRRVVVLTGVTGGRDPLVVANPLADLAEAFVAVRPLSVTASGPDEVARRLAVLDVDIVAAPDAEHALAEATRLAGDDGLVVVAGSLYLAGEIRGLTGR